jgi:cytochrome oxidase Cu insertion factor (SCO1/SenC/PrrC family)
MKNRKPLFLILALLALAGAVAALALCACCAFSGVLQPLFRNPSQLIGQPAPDFTLKDLKGRDISLNDYWGQVVLLNFWSAG